MKKRSQIFQELVYDVEDLVSIVLEREIDSCQYFMNKKEMKDMIELGKLLSVWLEDINK